MFRRNIGDSLTTKNVGEQIKAHSWNKKYSFFQVIKKTDKNFELPQFYVSRSQSSVADFCFDVSFYGDAVTFDWNDSIFQIYVVVRLMRIQLNVFEIDRNLANAGKKIIIQKGVKSSKSKL